MIVKQLCPIIIRYFPDSDITYSSQYPQVRVVCGAKYKTANVDEQHEQQRRWF